MARGSTAKQGVWCPSRAEEIEQGLERLKRLADDCDMVRSHLQSHHAWLAHARLIELEAKLVALYVTNTMALQTQGAPEKAPLSALTGKALHNKVLAAAKELKKLSASSQILTVEVKDE